MSNRNRGLLHQIGLIGGGFVAATILSATSIGWGLRQSAEYEREANGQARHYAENTRQQIGKACLKRIAEEQPDCINQARQEQRDNERNEYDLVAQRQSALWAYVMALAAVVGMGLSVVGVFLVWTTFRETRRSADAAHDANRPWVRVTSNPEWGFKLIPEGLAYDVDLKMTNVGNSPALDVSYLATFLFFDPSIEELRDLVPNWFDGDGKEWRDKIIFQGDSWERRCGAVHSGAAPGPTKVNFIVAVRYRTSFDKKWRYTVRVYSLHPVTSEGNGTLDLTNLANARGLGTAYFDEHQRIAGIAT